MALKEIEETVLKEMIKINTERRESYLNALEKLHSRDHDLKVVFAGMSHQSDQNISELTQTLRAQELDPKPIENQPIGHLKGDQKNHGHSSSYLDKQNALKQCEKEEAVVKKAYEHAISIKGISLPIQSLLEEQQTKLKAAHHHIEVLKKSMS